MPHYLFSFRWTHGEGETGTGSNSFSWSSSCRPRAAAPSAPHRDRLPRAWLGRGGGGRRLPDHVSGWDFFLPNAEVVVREWRRADECDGRRPVVRIGDPTRRRMLDLLLIDGPGTATSLSERLPVTRQAVAKHLGVLDQAGLVHGTTARGGRSSTASTRRSSPAPSGSSLEVGATWDARLRTHPPDRRAHPALTTPQRTKEPTSD